MTQCEQIVEFFKEHGWKATLGEILDAGRFSFSHKFLARCSDLRKKGYEIICEKGPNPSKNTYTMRTPTHGDFYTKTSNIKHEFDSFGQGVLL